MNEPARSVPLRELAHARSGEKGDDVYLAVIAYEEHNYELLRALVTEKFVAQVFGPILKGKVERFEVPGIGALNFALHGALDGGRTRNLAFDESGKALSSRILGQAVVVPAGFVTRSERSRLLSLPPTPGSQTQPEETWA
jgi:hypothetical protein